MRVVFWLSLVLVLYVYVGYPALLLARRRRPRVADLPDEALPRVTLLIAAHNEAGVIRQKIENSLRLDYPPDRLEILVVSDGSTDATNDLVRSFGDRGVRLHEVRPRGGKTRALNLAMPLTDGEIVVLSDANTMYRADAVRKLVRHFGDRSVGAVSGDVRLVDSAPSYAASEGLYYRYERFIQKQESTLGAIIGADGAMYAIRRALFKPVPPEVVDDDFVISMQIACRGFKVRYEPEAVAIEQGTLSSAEEFRRKVRVVAGGFQALRLGLGVPRFTQPALLWCYASHKLLRWLTPWLLLAQLAASLALAGDAAYAALAAVQLLFYCNAGAHMAVLRSAGRAPSLTTVPYYFCLVNAAALLGLIRALLRSQSGMWAPTRRAETQP